MMDVFDENIIKHDQEDEETTSDCSLREDKELLEDYGMRITEKEIETTREEGFDKTVILKKLQNYYFNLDESSICLRCGTTFRSNQNGSIIKNLTTYEPCRLLFEFSGARKKHFSPAILRILPKNQLICCLGCP